MASEVLTLVPVTGKYCSLTDPASGKTLEVWRVNPQTGQIGTKIPYKDAVSLLCKQPPLVALHDGVLEPGDMAKVREAHLSGHSALPSSLAHPSPSQPSAQSTEQLMAVIASQAEQMAKQTEQMNQFIHTVNSLTQTVADLQSRQASGDKEDSPGKAKSKK